MTQRSLIQVRVEESLRKDAEALFKDLGLDMPSAVRLFLKQSLLQRGIPFAIVKPDDFYNEYNQQILAKSIEQLNAGTGKTHELIEVADE